MRSIIWFLIKPLLDCSDVLNMAIFKHLSTIISDKGEVVRLDFTTDFIACKILRLFYHLVLLL